MPTEVPSDPLNCQTATAIIIKMVSIYTKVVTRYWLKLLVTPHGTKWKSNVFILKMVQNVEKSNLQSYSASSF